MFGNFKGLFPVIGLGNEEVLRIYTQFFGVGFIKSVFGIGGAYPGDEILVTVAFCRDHFEEPHAEHFMPLTTLFRGATRALVAEARIFAG